MDEKMENLKNSKPEGKKLKVVAVIAVVVLVLAVVFVNSFGNSAKGKAISAVKALLTEEKELTQAFYNDFPFLKTADEIGKGSFETSLTGNLESIGSWQNEKLADLLRKAKFSIDVKNDSEENAVETSVEINLFGSKKIALKTWNKDGITTFALPSLLENTYYVKDEDFMGDKTSDIFEGSGINEIIDACKNYPDVFCSVFYKPLTGKEEDYISTAGLLLNKASFEKEEDGVITMTFKPQDIMQAYNAVLELMENGNVIDSCFSYLGKGQKVTGFSEGRVELHLTEDKIDSFDILLDIYYGSENPAESSNVTTVKIRKDIKNGRNINMKIFDGEDLNLNFNIFRDYNNGIYSENASLSVFENEKELKYQIARKLFKDKEEGNAEFDFRVAIEGEDISDERSSYSTATIEEEDGKILVTIPNLQINKRSFDEEKNLTELRLNEVYAPAETSVSVPEGIDYASLGDSDRNNLAIEITGNLVKLLLGIG